ncbi:MAG: hypothetical protein CSA39_00050 [Flavobacteriales bacterium]|nr:MAG: hypothetical protein CR989_01050 [Flavobacteriales bacterium]PIE49944.1 MAG: hypothetical protein CSA39_00050 [Flavobacteriales bacterium]
MFKKGEIVVCVDAKKRWYKLGGLKKGEMYTIKGFNPYDGGLILEEVKSPSSGYHAYAANRFRKVDYNFADDVLSQMIQEMPVESKHNTPELEPVLAQLKKSDIFILN